MDFFDSLKAADPIFKRRQATMAPLQRARDIDFETLWQTAAIEREGHRVVHVADTRGSERVLVYRMFFHDGIDDEAVMLGARVLSINGVKGRDPQMLLTYYPEDGHLMLDDLRVDKEDAGCGYGSALMAGMFKVIGGYDQPVKYISGWISGVDLDHVDRSVGFYSKHGFECELNHQSRSGNILWVNPDAGGSAEEFKRSIENAFEPK